LAIASPVPVVYEKVKKGTTFPPSAVEFARCVFALSVVVIAYSVASGTLSRCHERLAVILGYCESSSERGYQKELPDQPECHYGIYRYMCDRYGGQANKQDGEVGCDYYYTQSERSQRTLFKIGLDSTQL
jgi:hypothetical protein